MEEIKKILEKYLRSNNLRRTKEREIILEEIYNYSKHFTIEELYIFLKNKGYKISRATVYNTIDVLLQCGLIKRHLFDQRSVYYEKSYRVSQHDHIICKNCGEIIEFCDPRLNTLISDLANIYNFQIISHELYLFAICKKCKNDL